MSLKGKTGVLLVNLGTPDTPQRGAVYRYLRQFLLDPRVIDYPWLPRQLLVQGIIAPFRSGSSAKLYQRLWTKEGSPLKVYGERLAAGVQSILGDEYAVALAMRYQQPSIQAALKQLLDQQVDNIVILPLFPQYASATTGSVFEEVMRILAKEETMPSLRFISDYCDYEPMIAVFASNASAFDIGSYDHIIFSYHGLPQRQLRKADRCNHCLQKADCCQTLSAVNRFCYSAQCHATTKSIAARLHLPEKQYTTTFQSRLGPEKWAQPYTGETIRTLAAQGAKRLLVFSPAFVADCLETLIEIKVEYLDMFIELGGEHLDLVPSLNDDPRWYSAVADLIRKNAS